MKKMMMVLVVILLLVGCGNRTENRETEPFIKGIETEEILVEEILVEEVIVEETIEEKPVYYWYLAIRLESEDGGSYYRDIILDGEPEEVIEEEYTVKVTYVDGKKVSMGFAGDRIGGTKVYFVERAE